MKKTSEVSLNKVRLTDNFLNPYYKLVCDRIIPYQWEALNDRVEGAEKSHCIANIKIAAGLSKGEFYGRLFQDSDVAKWLETVAYCLQNGDAAEFEALADEAIDLIAAAQEPDGYFNTYFQLTAPERKLTNLYEAHELYCLGHLTEAAVSYYQATGKRKLLDITLRFIELIDSHFGNEAGKRKGYPGHQEMELALSRLYEETGDARYLKLGKFFLDERGQDPNYFTEEWAQRKGLSEWTKREEQPPADYSYNQAHKPVREQTEAVGHAVRAMYMYAAMADIGRQSDDASLLDACRTLFEDVRRQMYVTGGIGSTNHGEAFSFAYDLPNEINYSETCASIGLVFFMHSMLKAEAKGAYADVMERALYNTVLAGIGTDGESYFYVNPMEIFPEASEKNPARKHVKAERQKWHACACCPPNAARLLASIGKYLYTTDNHTVYVHLYAASEAAVNLASGDFSFSVQTEYPLDGKVTITVKTAANTTFAFRIPGWCQDARFRINGECVNAATIKDGYAYLTSAFSCDDVIELLMEMEPRVIYAHTKIRADAGKVCLQRGPLVYCLEEADNGADLHNSMLDISLIIKERYDTIGGMRCVVLDTSGFTEADVSSEMYSFAAKDRLSKKLTFVPYYLWGNRTPGEMLVWVREMSNI